MENTVASRRNVNPARNTKREAMPDFCFSAEVLRAIGTGEDGDEALADIYPSGVVVGAFSRD